MHHFSFFVAMLSWLMVNAIPVHAQGSLYKWVDAQGTVHYTNAPTGKSAEAVDDALPPASTFQSPTPPAETAKGDSETTDPNPTNGDDIQAPPNSEESTSDDTPEQASIEPSEESQPSDSEVSQTDDQEPPSSVAQDDSVALDEEPE